MRMQRAVPAPWRWLQGALLAALALLAIPAAADTTTAAIERAKGSVVAVGTYERTRTPSFEFRGTGFAVGDGTLIVTNAHVLPRFVDGSRLETVGIVIPLPGGGQQVQFREAKTLASDTESDLAVLKVGGAPLPALIVGDSDSVKEGQRVLFTGFPIGNALGPFAATHAGMVSAIAPIAIPQGKGADLDPKVVRRLALGEFPIFQLDATAYPGNSGSPLYSPDTGEVIGVVNMVVVKGTKEAVLTQPSGITYAMPAKHLRKLLQTIR
jgi:serine protease Do